ncbi:hypothetical protein VNO77_42349 [Canavalia gladiata]|uniref:Uncharacterized protein n=1 Tax=Canavalia gladiata TaxID=3824 RepID=A0AAN9K1G2_CANGL
MNTAQVTACQPGISVKNVSKLHMLPSRPCVLRKSIDPCSRLLLTIRAEQSFGLKCRPVLHSQKPLHICLAGGEGMVGNNDENSPWKAIEEAMEKFKGQSVEDVLRKQIEKGEFYDNDGSGMEPPGGGGSGSGGRPDGSDGSEDESSGSFEENLQVFLATSGLLFMYIYILSGKELTRLAKDYIRYLFGGYQSVRLRNVMNQWQQIYESFTAKEEEEEDSYWLEKAILYTPTWWQDPDAYGEDLRNYVSSNPDVAIKLKEELELDSVEDVMDYLDSDEDEDEDEDGD